MDAPNNPELGVAVDGEQDAGRDAGQAYEQALRWLVRREYARRELLRRLLARGFADEAANAAIDQLQQQGLQNDQRFVEEYIRARRSRGFGPLRIVAELGERGVDRELISEWLDERDSDWERLATEVLRKRFPELPAHPAAAEVRQRARCERFLRYRGFSTQQTRTAMRA